MTCSTCNAETMTAVDSLCKGCRLRAATRRRQKYVWTPERDAALRRAYQAKNKRLLSIELKQLVRRWGWPAYIFSNRAQLLGLRTYTCNRWKPDDLEAVRDLAGDMPAYKIAKRIGRSEFAVRNRLWMMDLESRVIEGYSVNELAKLFGVHHVKVETWITRRWLSIDDDYRVLHASVERFVWDHMEDYRFAACDEWWLKTMLKPLIGVRSGARKPAQKEAA